MVLPDGRISQQLDVQISCNLRIVKFMWSTNNSSCNINYDPSRCWGRTIMPVLTFYLLWEIEYYFLNHAKIILNALKEVPTTLAGD
jgi:hypothetical protein